MWAEWLFAHRKPVLVFILVLLGTASAGISRLTFSPDTRVFFDESDARFQALQEFENTFLPSHTIVFGLESSGPFYREPRSIVALRWLDERVAGMDGVRNVDSLASTSYAYDGGSSLVVETYLEYMCPNDCDPERLDLLESPLLKRRLVSDDGKILAVVGTFNFDRGRGDKISSISSQANEIREEFLTLFPRLKLYITGGIPMSRAFVDAGQRDSYLSFAISALVIGLLLTMFLGGVRNALAMLGTGIGAVACTMGIGGWLGIVLNTASAAVPIVVLTLVIATAMHIFSHYLRLCSDPRGPAFAATTALNVNLIPVVLTTLTSAISLSSLIFVNSPPVRDIGILSSIGVVIGGGLALTLTPLMLDTDKRDSNSKINGLMQRWLNNYIDYSERTLMPAIFVGLVLLISLFGLSKLQIDDDFLGYFGNSTEFMKSTNALVPTLAGPNHIEVSIMTKEGSVFDPRTLIQIEELTDKIRSSPAVANAVSLPDIQRNLVKAFAAGRFEDLSEASHSQIYFAFEMSLSADETVRDFVDVSKMQTHIPVFLSHGSAIEIQKLESNIYHWAEDLERLNIIVTGENIPVAYLSSSNIPAVVSAIASTLILTAFLLGIYFQNYRVGLISFVAIAVPVLAGFGMWGFLSGTIGLAGSIVIAIALGVVIDDAIHLIFAQHRARKLGQTGWESTKTSVYRVGVPIISTTLLFVIGLSPLLFSEFRLNATVASCTGIILVMSLFFDLGILPRMLQWSTRPGKELKDD